MSRGATCLSLLLVVAASPAAAAGGGGGGVMESLVMPALNLLLLLGLLFYVSRKPIKAFFADRRAQIQGQLQSAADLNAQAESRLDEWQGKLAGVEAEIEELRETARSRAEAEREAILADAEATAERIRRDSQAAIDQELRRAREKLREEAADLAVELAARTLSEQVTDADRDRLLDEFIERVEQTPSDGGGR